jgi:hypothetical protein
MAIMMEFADIFDDGITTAIYIYSATAVLVYAAIAIAVVTEHPKKPVDVAASVPQLHRLCSQPDACSENETEHVL